MFSDKNACGTYLVLGLQIYDPALLLSTVKKRRVVLSRRR